jgi:hypothetical protein
MREALDLPQPKGNVARRFALFSEMKSNRINEAQQLGFRRAPAIPPEAGHYPLGNARRAPGS